MPPSSAFVRAAALSAILALPGGAGLLALFAFNQIGLVAFAAAGFVVLAGAAALGTLVIQELARFLAALQTGGAPRIGLLARLSGAAPALEHLVGSLAGRSVGRDAAESILDGLAVPLLLLDSERRVVKLNRAAGQLVGTAGLNRDLTASLRHPALLQAVDAVLAGEAARDLEFSLAVPVERHIAAHVRKLASDLPDFAAIVTLDDMTVIRRGEQMRADFVANASHELRTPLATLLGFVETLRGPARDDESARERFLAIMHDQAMRMTRLVNDLMSLSRIELFEHTPPTGLVNIAETLRGVTDALRPQADDRKMRIELDCAATLPPVIGDEDQIAQVFQNLVVNAIKYARQNTAVTVRAWHTTAAPGLVGGTAGAIGVAVIDRGEGIDRQHLPRLTERFYRVDPARSRQLGGTGLGLAIVKHIVSRHRGELTIDSKTGAGSEFTVYLPAGAQKEMSPDMPAISAASPASQKRNNTVALP